jgi:hypothetical protein
VDLRATVPRVIILVALGCTPHHARYPSWEPTSPVVPAVPDRDTARRYLEASWSAFESERARHGPDTVRYTYVRAREVSGSEVHFTALAVEGGRVVRRALLAADPRKLAFLQQKRDGDLPIVRWEERGADVGSHPGAAAPITIETLYDICRHHVLEIHPELTVRLYFHRTGVLEQCGFLVDDCRDCAAASIQSYLVTYRSDHYSFPSEHQTPLDYLCTDRFGLFPAGSDYLLPGPNAGSWCRHVPRDVWRGGEARSGLKEICDIDPDACMKSDLGAAFWQPRPPVRPVCELMGGLPTLVPAKLVVPADLGKPNPCAPPSWGEVPGCAR